MDNPMQALFSQLRTTQASSPALVWYGADAERVELSGRVLENWAAKTANLLVEELDAAPGTALRLHLPVHWKALVLILGAWAAGSPVEAGLPDGGPNAADRGTAAEAGVEVFATASAQREDLDAAAGVPMAVALGALQMRWDQDLPAGAVDYAAEVRSFADSFDDFGTPSPEQPALSTPQGALPWSAVEAGPGLDGAAGDGTPVVLVQAEAGLLPAVEAALAAWQAGGTVVLTGDGRTPDEALLAAERVTTRCGA